MLQNVAGAEVKNNTPPSPAPPPPPKKAGFVHFVDLFICSKNSYFFLAFFWMVMCDVLQAAKLLHNVGLEGESSSHSPSKTVRMGFIE